MNCIIASSFASGGGGRTLAYLARLRSATLAVLTFALDSLDFGLATLVDLEVNVDFVGEMGAGDGGASCVLALAARGRRMDKERKRFMPLRFEGATPTSWEEGIGGIGMCANALAESGPDGMGSLGASAVAPERCWW